MIHHRLPWALVVLAVALTACTVPLGTSSRGTVTLSLGSSGASGSSRVLSLANDVDSMEYQVTDLTGGEAIRSGAIAAGTRVLSFSLTAGHTYEVAVIVWPKSEGPGTTTGVTTFGDSALVTPVAGSAQVVPLWIRPFDTWAFHNAVVNEKVSAWSPLDNETEEPSITATSTDPTNARFFYGARGELYWFEGQNGRVFSWPNVKQNIDAENPVFTTASVFTATQYVVTADPLVSNTFYVLGVDTELSKASLRHVVIPTDGAAYSDGVWDLSDALNSGNLGTDTFTATALAVNPVTKDIFVAGFNSGSYMDQTETNTFYRLRSTIRRFSLAGTGEGAGPLAASAAYGETAWFDATGAQSIWRDLTFRGGELLALGSPAIDENGFANVGTATVVRLTPALEEVGRLPAPAAQTYTANTGSPVESTGGTLGYPVSFATGGHGATVYVNQGRSSAGNSNETLTEVNLVTGDGTAISDVTVSSSQSSGSGTATTISVGGITE